MMVPIQVIRWYRMQCYDGTDSCAIVVPFRRYCHIKKVAAMCGIKKRVSFHVSRHSWAVLALEYGMPIESVSKILGHTNITTTQIYAKVTSTKLNHDISVFESRIKGHLPVMGGMA